MKLIEVKKIIPILWKIWYVSFFIFLIFSVYTINRYSSIKQFSDEYFFPWPGILPDNKLYKVKVLRDKITEKIIISPVKKIEFDLLMADKRIYASKLIADKGKIALAKDTVLKGENYYSMLVQDYNTALLKNNKIPSELDVKITQAAIAHQKVFKQLESGLSGEDKKTFQIVYKFSKINYDFIVGLRNQVDK